MIKDNSPKISIIIPVYNREFCIANTINSILKQTYNNCEIILVNDGSTDNTESIINDYLDKCINVKLLNQNNSGACVARNYGLSKACGDYVIFLDSDDMLEIDHITKYVETMLLRDGSCVYGPWSEYTYDEGSLRYGYTSYDCPSKDLLEAWLKGWWICCCCIMWPIGIVNRLGGWDNSLAADQDGDLAMRALVNGVEFIYCKDAPPAKIIHYVGEGNISRTKSIIKLKSRQKVMEKLEELMIKMGTFEVKYRKALATRYYNYAYYNVKEYPEFADECYVKYKELNGWGRPPGSIMNWIFTLLLGLRKKEKLSELLSNMTNKFNRKL